MVRPKRPFSGQDTIQRSTGTYFEKQLGYKPGSRQRLRWAASTRWYYRTPNGNGDPLSYLCVLDALMTIDTDVELRAGNLTDWLNVFYQTISWDSVTVGRILMDLCDGFRDKLGAENALLVEGFDRKGRFYVYNVNLHSAALAYALRDELQVVAEREMDVRAKHQRTDYALGVLLECPSVRLEWVDPNLDVATLSELN